MSLEPLPDHRRRLVIVGTTVRKPLPVLAAYLNSLDWQAKGKDVDFHFVFVPDYPEKGTDAEAHLRDWVKFRGGTVLRGAPSVAGDFAEGPGLDTHQWSAPAMARVGHNKNLILRYALEHKADAIWLPDADLVMDRTTFASLDALQKPIATAVYWTRWSKRQTETQRVPASPQVWLLHPYQLSGRGMDEAEFRQKLINKEVTRVYGFGACTLFDRRVIEAGVNFSYLPDVSQQGLMAGEDRHLSIRAERLHIESVADPWPDIGHVYHAEDVQKIPEWTERCGQEHPQVAGLGDLVSLRLRALEPLPVGPGRLQQVAPQNVRGRLGAIPLAPELEEAVSTMQRGETNIVRVHHPLSHPAPFFRNRTRLIQVDLLDVKANRPSPVLDEDLYWCSVSGRVLDKAGLSGEQHESIAEVVNG